MTRVALYTPPDANRVLRGARVISTADRPASSTDYATVRVGVADGTAVDYYGTYDGSITDLDMGAPLRVTGASDLATKVATGRAIVAEVTVAGSASLEGLSVQIEVGHTLTMPAMDDRVTDFLRNTKSGDQILTVPLRDVVTLGRVGDGTFHAYMEHDSATQLSLGAYGGRYVDVAGTLVDTATDIVVTTSDGLVNASGSLTATTPGTSTLYGVYLSKSGLLRMSATATPTRVNGILYLTAAGDDWRFAGWARTNASTQFVNTVADRLVINYYNRRPLPIQITPGYVDANSATTYTTTSTTFTPANAGTGSAGSYIANGEDAVVFHLSAMQALSGATTYSGIGDNSTTAAYAVAGGGGAELATIHASLITTPAAGYRTVNLLIAVSGGTGTWYADQARLGSAADPYGTKISGWVMG